MGTVATQQRAIQGNAKDEFVCGTSWGEIKHPFSLSNYAPPMSGSQVTTSYRTGGLWESIEDPVPDSNLSAFAQYKNEYDARHSDMDNGNDFNTIKQEVYWSHKLVNLDGGASWSYYRGPLAPVASAATGTFPVVPDMSTSWYGPRAIKATAPTNPNVDLVNALAELKREGLPRLPGMQSLESRTGRAREAGGEHLNIEFGWKPILSDLMAFKESLLKHKRILKQFQRDAGKKIRRSYTFPTINEADMPRDGTIVSLVQPTGVPTSDWMRFFYNGKTTGEFTETITRSTRVWFSGAYSYLLPPSEAGSLKQIEAWEQAINHLFGTRITPSKLWELAPWSWFGDWFGSIGDTLANASALTSDGLVLQYGYLMCESVYERTCTLEGIRLRDGSYLAPISVTYSTTRKERKRATPYGFGLNPNSFTDRQWAILAALGLTKAPRKLP